MHKILGSVTFTFVCIRFLVQSPPPFFQTSSDIRIMYDEQWTKLYVVFCYTLAVNILADWAINIFADPFPLDRWYLSCRNRSQAVKGMCLEGVKNSLELGLSNRSSSNTK